MKTKHLLLLILIAVFGSCSTAYRTGQTPDDVYYSPAPPAQNDYVRTDNQQDKDQYAYNNTYNNEDLEIRRGIRDQRYRSNISLDCFNYGYNSYDYGSYYNPYSHTGLQFYPYSNNYYSYYSPYNNYYYPPVYYSKYPSPVSKYTGARKYNLGVYNNNPNTNTNRVYIHSGQSTSANSSAPVRTFKTQSSNRSGVGNFIRRVITSSDNNTRSYSNDNSTNNNNSSQVRTIQTNTSGSNSSSSSGSAPVRTFRK
ncbi:MAG: hypothetical protein ABI834_05755 [Ginsengibacter sp.]